MCLNLNAASKIEVRATDTVVYKRLKYSYMEGMFLAPYRETPYKRGEIKRERVFSEMNGGTFKTKLPASVYGNGINQGLHTYREIRDAGYGEIIVECVIPAGTPLIVGTYDVVSLALVIGEAVIGETKLVDDFNSNIATTATPPQSRKHRLFDWLANWLESR